MDTRSVRTSEIEAIGEFVIVELITRLDKFKDEVKERSGLLIADTAQGTPSFGRVVSIGPDVKKPRMYEEGDTVVFKDQKNFQGFKHDDLPMAGLHESRIVAVVNE